MRGGGQPARTSHEGFLGMTAAPLGRPPDNAKAAPGQGPPRTIAVPQRQVDRSLAESPDTDEPSLWGDWSVDVDQLDYDDDQDGKYPAQFKAHSTYPTLPSERHKQLLMVLDGRAKLDQHGRRVTFGRQDRLAERLGIKRRRLQELIADLRTPERDPRHLKVEPAGLRLGLFRVEPSRRPDPDRPGQNLYGVNRYTLLFPQGVAATMQVAQSAPARKRLSAGQLKAHRASTALHNEETPASEEREVVTPSVTTAPCAREVEAFDVLALMDVGQQRPMTYDEPSEVLALLDGALGPLEVLGEWRTGGIPPRLPLLAD
jgi:hypothetical protein